MSFTALLFDMDGLMVDTERLYIHANEIIARQYRKEVTHVTIAKMMGRGTMESLRIYIDDLGIDADPADLAVRRHSFMLDLIASDLIAMPGLREILAFARPIFRLGVVTGSATSLMNEILGRLQLQDSFELTQSCDQIQFGKPNPEVYLRACARLGLRPQQCIVLEDSANGVRAGVAAGCYTIAVPNEYTRAAGPLYGERHRPRPLRCNKPHPRADASDRLTIGPLASPPRIATVKRHCTRS